MMTEQDDLSYQQQLLPPRFLILRGYRQVFLDLHCARLVLAALCEHVKILKQEITER